MLNTNKDFLVTTGAGSLGAAGGGGVCVSLTDLLSFGIPTHSLTHCIRRE